MKEADNKGNQKGWQVVINFAGIRPVSSVTWLRYFVASLGLGLEVAQAQEQVLLNHCWIKPQEEVTTAPRVIRVQGEKGESYQEVVSYDYLDALKQDSAIREALLDRQEKLRRNAMQLVRELKAAGKSPLVAYEEAWATVYRQSWLNANWGEGSSKLEDMLTRLAEADEEWQLTEDEVQWILEALLEDDSRLDSEDGKKLLRKLAQRLRSLGYGKLQTPLTLQDELMLNFADALREGHESMAAYRDAMFKTYRGQIQHNQLVGYRAPLGMGIKASAVYRQAPVKVTLSGDSANSQPVVDPLIPGNPAEKTPEGESVDFTAGMNKDAGKLENFLAGASDSADEKQEADEEEKEHEDELIVQNGQTGQSSSYSPWYDYRTYYPRRAVAAEQELPILTWDGSTGNDTWKVNGDSAATPWQGGAVYTDGSHVTFSSTTAVKDVQLDGTVRPGSITVSGTTPSTSDSKTLGYNYAFTGHGTIADYIGGSTSIRVEGSATLVLNSANTFSGGITLGEGTSLYAGCENATGTGTITMNNGSKLIVNYNSSDVNYRSPELANTIDVSGSASISYGTAAYNDTQLPSEWRNLSVTGGINGSGSLNLYGYTYTSKPSNGFLSFNYTTTEYNYVSNFSINEKHRTGDEKNRFNGTVYLKNEFNHRASSFSEKSGDKSILGGAVQLTLVDNVFANATINLTRDVGERTVGREADWLTHPQSEQGLAMTSDNILVLSDSASITVKALEAQFLGKAWHYDTRHGITATYVQTVFNESCSQADERKLVRVVTDGLTTLVLDGSNDTGTHVFSGSMGFEQTYTKSTESSILLSNCVERERSGLSYKDPTPVEDCISSSGEGSHGVASLSLVKSGSSAQYIHSAKLNTLSLQGGTLGFNNLDLTGYLNITSGTTLQLGVTGSTKTKIGESQVTVNTGWESISDTSSTVTIQSGKELLVMSAAKDGVQTVNVSGSITMSSGSDIMFSVLGSELGTSTDTALLQLKGGSLTLEADVPINVSFASVNLAQSGKAYYLVSTDSGISASAFQPRYVPIGHGYYGLLEIENSKYLVLSVVGDPSRTWSGNTTDMSVSAGKWEAAPISVADRKNGYSWNDKYEDHTWKENQQFFQGVVTLFGNLNEPVGWKEGNWGPTSTKTSAVTGGKNDGTKVQVEIDGVGYENQYQKVDIVGDVAPATISINADYILNGKSEEDDTCYYFYSEDGTGYIRDALNSEIWFTDFEQTEDWKTTLIKSGKKEGTAVIATDNTFSGGSLLEGGRLVMQRAAALGTGGITVQNGVILQGDFADSEFDVNAFATRAHVNDVYFANVDDFAQNWRNVTSSGAYVGEQMDTTTILNPVYVGIYVDTDGSISANEVDAYIAGAYDKKLVLASLSGGAETVVTLMGNSKESGKYTYSAFKVLDPGSFYGTIKMDGNLRGALEGDIGGNVQLEIMTTAKSTGGGDWLNAKVDLSVENGTNRTVLALDALGTGTGAVQIAQVDSLHGSCSTAGRMNSSVLNMSKEKEILLEIIGANSGSYQGVLGFGDFQKTVDYNSSKTDIGMEKHSYGTADASAGVLSVRKQGNATQTVYSAWIKSLAVEGGNFGVNEALVIQNLSMAGGTHLVVGNASFSYSHAVVVGAGGVLAFDAATDSDVFANIGPGIDAYTKENEDATGIVLVPPSSFVLLTNGSTISAHDNWKTTIDTFAYKGLDDKSLSVEFVTDIAPGATVTVNTHNFTPDESIDGDNDVFGNYRSSHVIQLLGKMTGHDVHLMFNNELISAAAVKDGSARKRADGLGYEGATGAWMGYAAIRDIHQFTGDITVEGMTVLQVTNTNSSAASASADMDITVQGANAALQFTDTVTDQYINNLVLKNGGHVLIGGVLKNTTSAEEDALDMSSVETAVTHRGAETASITNLNMKNSGTQVELGGTAAETSVVTNAAVSTTGTATTLKIHQAELHNSVVLLHSACSLDLTEAVLVDKNSAVLGATSSGDIKLPSVAAVAAQGLGEMPTTIKAGETVTVGANTTVKLTTSGGTVYTSSNGAQILHVYADQFQNVNVTGTGLTLILADDLWAKAYSMGMEFVAIQVGGSSGQFLFESANNFASGSIGANTRFSLTDSKGRNLNSDWVTSTFVGSNVGSKVSGDLLWIQVPEPATATLSLLALTALAARRRRKH